MNLDQYKLEYEEAMRMQGVTVTWAEDGGRPYGEDVGGYTTNPNWVATLSRDGVSVETLVSAGRIQLTGMDPYQLARQDMDYALRRAGQLGSPEGELPSNWFLSQDDDTRRFYELNPHLRPGTPAATVSTPGAATRSTSPGPATTVQVGGATIQTQQAPPNPNNGTVLLSSPVDAARGGSRLTFWQWNYYWQQTSGRSGPDPAEVGVASGDQLMTGEEWVRAVGNWYGAPVSVPPIRGSAGAGVGATPTTPPIQVGGTGTPPAAGGTGGGTGAGGNPPPVGSTPTGGGGTGVGPVKRSFWDWNAIKEQATGIVGDDPANYSIMGTDLLTLAEWTALTADYYATKTAGGGGSSSPAKGTDTAVLVLGALAAAVLLFGRKG